MLIERCDVRLLDVHQLRRVVRLFGARVALSCARGTRVAATAAAAAAAAGVSAATACSRLPSGLSRALPLTCHHFKSVQMQLIDASAAVRSRSAACGVVKFNVAQVKSPHVVTVPVCVEMALREKKQVSEICINLQKSLEICKII